MPSPILRQIDPVNAFTLSGLALAFLSAIFSLQQHFYAALICLMGSGLVDLFDGFLARKLKRTPTQSQVGQQLDSLVDLCAFGFTPAFFGYCFGLREPWAIVLLLLFLGANASRLAYFNIAGVSGGEGGGFQYFTGMPVTYSAVVFPLVFLTNFFASHAVVRWSLAAAYAAMAVAMVSGAKIPKPRGIAYVILPVCGAVMIVVYGWAIASGRAVP